MRNCTEGQNPEPRPNCTIEQPRELLEQIRSRYQSLSSRGRTQIKHSIAAAALRAHNFTGKDGEQQCFESAL
jgi:hypothetical protein